MGQSMHRHFKLFKPYGYLSQFKLAGNSKKRLLGDFFDFPEGTMSIGRLDKPSEGLLLLTTDGKVSHLITSRKVEKEYYVQVDGTPTEEAIEKLRTGIKIITQGEEHLTLPAKVERIATPKLPDRAKKIREERHGPTSWLSITIREGKFRQVRKMTAAIGCPTLRLVRYRVGNITIEEMKAGEVAELDPEFYVHLDS